MPAATSLTLRRWLLPLVFFQLYLSLTVWLFFFGPWPWDVDNPMQLFGYLAAAQVAIAVGYLMSWRRLSRLRPSGVVRELDLHEGIAFLKFGLVVSALLALPSSLSRTGALLPDVLGGIANAGAAYNENFERLEAGNAFVVVEYVRMLLSPWLIGVFPLLVLYWGRLGWSWRSAGLAIVALNLAMFLATGTNKGIADVVVTLPWLVIAAVWAGTLRIRKLGLKLGVATVLLLAAFLYFFGAGQQQREGSGSEYGSFFTGTAVLLADSGHFISSWLPEAIRPIFEALSRYVVHGYYALALALTTDTPSTLGVGHSMFLARNADAIFGGNFFVWQSIPGVLEQRDSWGMFLFWHSIYPWLASDFGFAGALLVIGALAWLLGLSWGHTLASASARWTVMLYLLLVLFFYVPANNQIFQSGESAFAFFILLVMLARGNRSRRIPAPARPAQRLTT